MSDTGQPMRGQEEGPEAPGSLDGRDGPAEVSLLDVAIVLAKHKRLVLGVPVVSAVIAASVSLLIPNVYTATARILPPQQNQPGAALLLGQLGGLTAATGTSLGLKNPSDLFVAILKSRTVADSLIQEFDLKPIYDKELLTDVRKKLADRTEITTGREGVIKVEVDDRDPKRAAALANAYAAELETLTLNLAVTEAGQRRLFFEKQLAKARGDLTNAEIALQRFQEKTGLISPEAQSNVTIATAAGLRAQVTAKEVQIAALRSFATDRNPDLIRTEEELVSLRAHLARMDRDAGKLRGDLLMSLSGAPEVGAEYIQRYRDMKYYETLYELLAKQYELARIDEGKNATVIQILDRAVEPDKKSGPKRALIVLITGIATLSLAVIAAFWIEGIQNARQHAGRRGKMLALRAHFRSL